jgi:predicted phage baseplate assembly protein
MSRTTPLCVPPPDPPAGCCDAGSTAPAAPVAIVNPPGLSAIRYRVGTFTSFRRAMLDAVIRPDLLGATPNPFARWHEGTDADYHTVFLELWAYLADVLTFYQERIANEAFIATATQRDSLLRLAGAIGYRPLPGAGASALVAFTVENDKTVTVPARFRVGSRAQPGRVAAVFETESAITARGEHSAIPLSATAPTNQFAPLKSFGALLVGSASPLDRARAASHLFGTAGAALLRTFGAAADRAPQAAVEPPANASGSRRSEAPTIPGRTSGTDLAGNPASASPLADVNRTIVLEGVKTRLAVGDVVLAVANEGAAGAEQATLHQLTSVEIDKAAGTTTVTWAEPDGTTFDQTSREVTLYAFRVKAGAFGNKAPRWDALPLTLIGTTQQGQPVNGPYANRPWDDPNNAASRIPEGPYLFLDAVYDAVRGTPQIPGWAALTTDDRASIVHVTDARAVSKADYAISAKVTRLTLGAGEAVPGAFPLRETVILTGSERLRLHDELPLPDPLGGSTLVLAGLFPHLQPAQPVILHGNLWDPVAGAATTIVGVESATLAAPPSVDAANAITTVTLKQPLARQYARAGAVLLANVVTVTHGETVADEVLGSGDGTALQSFPLKRGSLTYLPSTAPEAVAAVTSTLLVTVNGVRWTEQPTLVGSGPETQAFTTTLDEAGQTTVVFGDGFAGAAPPSGKDNVRARYRKGLGTSGNVPAGGVEQLIDSLPGLQKVTSPQPSSGGADAETVAQIRVNAPGSVRAFGRAVSAEDYAALALTYPGIVKAGAMWATRSPTTLQAFAQPYVQLTLATANRVPLAETPVVAAALRSFLDKRRDPNVPLRILDFTPVHVDVALTVDVDDRFPRQATLAEVQAALRPGLNADGTPGYFAFERLQFGESIHLSAVYAAVHAVAGVREATITRLRRMDLDAGDPTKVRDDIFVQPTEIAVIQHDPTDPARGRVAVVLGGGGFVDT